MNKKQPQELKLKGKTAVFVDWANVYNWKKSLSKPVDPQKLFNYLKKYPEVKSINFYFGTDKHPKSKKFIKEVKKIGYNVTTKPVKYIITGKVGETVIRQRKCDFDIEICMSIYEHLEKGYNAFVFFTGDGDFAPLYQFLIERNKQVLVIFEQGFLGREVWQIQKGLFKTQYSYLEVSKNNPPHSRRGRD